MEKKTVLVFVPHPDDAEFFAGGTICKFATEGNEIILVVATDGGKASFHVTSQELTLQRQSESRKAAEVLGIRKIEFLDYPDFELDQLPAGILRERFIFLIRHYKPDVLIAEDVLVSNEVHPDHRAVALAAAEAVSFSHLPLVYPEQINTGITPHFVVEKYFYSNNPASINKIVDISATFDRKLSALGKHESQVEFLVEEIFMQANLAGLNIEGILGQAAKNPFESVRWALEAQASEIGRKAGYTYGEAFRYVRFHPYIESVLPVQSSNQS